MTQETGATTIVTSDDHSTGIIWREWEARRNDEVENYLEGSEASLASVEMERKAACTSGVLAAVEPLVRHLEEMNEPCCNWKISLWNIKNAILREPRRGSNDLNLSCKMTISIKS